MEEREHGHGEKLATVEGTLSHSPARRAGRLLRATATASSDHLLLCLLGEVEDDREEAMWDGTTTGKVSDLFSFFLFCFLF